MTPPENVIVLCPCCASIVDATPAEDTQTFDCTFCGQTWFMVVSADRYSTHSLL